MRESRKSRANPIQWRTSSVEPVQVTRDSFAPSQFVVSRRDGSGSSARLDSFAAFASRQPCKPAPASYWLGVTFKPVSSFDAFPIRYGRPERQLLMLCPDERYGWNRGNAHERMLLEELPALGKKEGSLECRWLGSAPRQLPKTDDQSPARSLAHL